MYRAVSYQAVLLTELITTSEIEGDMSDVEADRLRAQVVAANSKEDIDELWCYLEHNCDLFDTAALPR